MEAIKAYQAAGAPVTLPSWASLQGSSVDVIGSAARPLISAAPALTPQRGVAASDTIVQLVSDGGTFRVPVTINGQLTLDFTVDSGASDVSVPADVFMTLVRTGTITDADYLDKQTYRMAEVIPTQLKLSLAPTRAPTLHVGIWCPNDTLWH
jgi:hypothetical protein